MNQRQTGKIIDLLSEGPIEGIVGDDAGIFLNGTPVIDSEERETLGYVPGEISFVSGVTYDFTPDSGFDLTEIDLAIGDRNIVVWDAINEGSTDAYIKEKKHPYVLRTPNVTWTDADIGSLIILGDGQNGATETFRVASIHIYSGANSFIKIDRASQGPYGASNTRQLWRAQIRQVQSIVNSTRITVDSAFTESLTNRKATILSINSTSLDTSVSTKNFDSVKTIFRSGRQDQPILDPVFGGGQTAFATNLNEEILQTTRSGPYSISGQDDKVYTATTTMGISSPENIDKVKINIRFPSLIAYSKIGSEYSQGIEFQIFLEYKRNGVWYNHTGTLANFPSNQPVLGISDDDIQNRNPVNIDSSSDTEKRVTKYALATSLSTKNDGMVITRSKTEFVKEFLIDSELTKSKPFTDFRIRIKRVTGVNIAIRDESQAQTQSYMQGIFAYSNDILNYANTAVAGISFQSNDFDAFPKRAYLARGIRVQVPTNYITREESGGSQAKYTRNVTTGADTGSEVRWDGKFRGDIADTSWRTNQGHVNYKKVYTNNPAWVYYDIMVNNRYGLGEFLEAQNINKYELYRIARYCDELVPDGKGGTEPRFTCNLYLQSRTEAFKVINDLASVFRSIVKWTNGEISASQDAPKAPIYTFSNSNVLDGQFGYESTSKRLRINQVGVTWNNPEDFYKQDVVTVEDSESILEEGKIIKKDTIAVGCTSEGQATRLGKWMLLTERLETELVKFRTGINGAYLRPGDVFYVQDYNRTNAIASGRLAQSNNHTTTTVYFDRTVPFEADTYQLHLAFPTGSAYLQQEQATINGTTYYRGDQITQAYVGGVLTNIDSTEDAADALDAASGNFVQLSWSEYISVESREFVSGSNQNLDSITVSSAFTSVPNSEVMFTLTNITDSNTAKGAVAYRTLNITENEDKTIDISGHLYLADKFAAVDRGYLLQPREFTPLPTFDNIRVPAPQNPSLSINRLSDTQDSTDVQLYSYVAEVSWGHPVVEGTDENYQYVDYYEIKHPYTPDRTYETAKATKATEFTFTSFVDPGQAYVLVRTVNIQGRRSAWSVVERAGTSDLTGSALNTISFLNLRAGGNIDTTVSVDSSNGTVSFGDEDFSLIGPQGNNYSITGATDLVEGSPAVANGEYFYIAFDASATSLKLLNIDIDTTAEDPATGSSPALNFEYWRESGQGDFTSVGTISQNIDILDLSDGSPGKALFINKFTTTADYSSSFSFGDTIRIGSGTSSWYGTVLEATATDITTVQYINKAFSSGAQIYSKDFKEDVALDFIIGRVLNSVGVYQLQLFAASKGSKGDTPETVSLSADKLVTKYDGDGLLLQASPDNNITLTATAGGGLGIEGISPSYRFLDNTGSPVQDWSQVNTYTIPEIDLPAEGSNIQYTVEATDEASPPYASEASDFVTIFTVSEGKDAETVNLVASSYVAKYDGTGSLIEASPDNNITITATPSAGLSSPTQYRFLDNTGSPVQDWSTDNDYIIPEVDLPQVNSTITYTVEATDGTSPYSSEASDNVTISALSDGLDGSPGTDGRPGLPGASRILPYDDLQSSLPNAAGRYAFLSGSTPAYVTSWEDIKSAEVIQLRPFTDPLTTNQSQYYDQIQEGDVITYYITSGKWVDYVVDVNNGLIGSPGAYEFEVTALEFDETGGTADPSTADGVGVKFRFSRATEAISGIITNDTHAEAADQDGVLLNDLTDAGGNFLVFKGIQEVTNESPAPSFAVGSPAAVDGLTMGINTAGVYSLSGTWGGTQAQFELTATYEGFTVTKQYTIVKTLEGAASVLGFLTNESHVEAADNAGDLLDNLSDAGGTFTVFDGVVDVTTGNGVVYSVVGGSGSPSVLTTSGLQMSVNTSTGVYTLSENSDWTADTTTFTLRAVYSAHSPSVTVDRVYTISKSKTGAAGAAGSDAQAVSLTADKYIAAYDGTGTLLDSSPTNNIILTASSQGFEASPPVEYRFLKNGVQVQAYSTTATYTIPEASLPAANAQDEYEVEAGSGGSPVEAFDTVSVYGLQDGDAGSPGAAGSPGEDAIVGFIENEAHVEPADFGGQLTSTPILDTAGGAFKVYEGITEVTSSTTFTVVGGSSSGGFHTKTQNGLKISIDETGAGIGEYTLSEDSDWTSDSETFTLRGVYNSVTVDKVYSISKTREGIPERIPGVKYGDGAMNWRLKRNLNSDNSTQNPGEIYVRAGTYRLPGGTTRVISADTQINTPFENAVNPKDWGSKDDFFYVFSYNSDVDTRFGAPSPNAGFGPAASDGLFTAVYVHDTQTWYATPNNSTGTASSYSFTPDEQDHIIALGFKDNAGILVSPPGDQGINLLYEVVPVVDEPLATIGATAGTDLFANDGSVIEDSVITNFDDASALSFNSAFTNWTGGIPDGWSKSGTFTLNQGTDSLTGPYAVECVCTGAGGGFMVRHSNETSPTITFNISGDAVLIGSVDVKISSYTNGIPGISADLMQSNSIYYRQVIPADTGLTGTWQRLYFKVSAYSNNVQGFAGPTPGNDYVGVKIGFLCDITLTNASTGDTAAFTGTVIYDNVRFAIIDPALENEQQIWTDINDTPAGGVNLIPPGWDSIDSAIRVGTMTPSFGSPEFIDTSPVLFDVTSIKTTGTNETVYLATSATDYNIYGIKPNTKYMLSAYVYPSIIGSSFSTFSIRLRQDDSTMQSVGVRSQITAANAWNRIYAIVETDGGVTDSGVFTIYYADGSSQTVYIDGAMVEEYLGGDDANAIPSAFTRSGTAGAPSGTYIGNVSSDAVAGTVDGTGSLGNVVSDDGGGTYRHVVKGLFGGTANDGDSIAFTQTWNAPPSVLFGAGGRVDYGSPLTGDVYQDYKALNITTTGFDASLKIKETVGTITNRTETTSGASGQDFSIIKTVAAEAFDDNYTYKYNVSIQNGDEWFPGEYEPGAVTVGFYTKDGALSWELRGTQTISAIGLTQPESVSDITKVISVDGLGLNDDFGISVISSVFAGSSITAFTNVTYGTATAPTEASATDNAAPIPFIVLGD